MSEFKIQKFQVSRIASIDVCAVGQQKHHIAAKIEVDVTSSREKIRKYRKEINKISFNAWLIKTISRTIKDHEPAAAYLKGKNKILIFKDINVSIVIEKEINGQKVPIPLIIEKANERSIEWITGQIDYAKRIVLSELDIVLQKAILKLFLSLQ